MRYNQLCIVLLGVVALGMATPSLRDEIEIASYPANGENLWDFIEKIYNDYKIIVNGVVIFVGLFLCFFGLKSVVFDMFLCGFLAGGIPTFVIATDLLANMANEKQAFWISIGSSCVMGLIVGILLTCLYQIGHFVIGAALGSIIAIYTDVILECILRFHSNVVLYVAVGAIGLEFGIFALIWDKIVVILGTAVIGSYLITLGLSQFLGNWINPFSPLFPQHLMNTPWQWYLYFGLIAGFTIFGVIVQAMTNRNNKEEGSDGSTAEAKMPLIGNEPEKPKTNVSSTSKEKKYKPLKELQA